MALSGKTQKKQNFWREKVVRYFEDIDLGRYLRFRPKSGLRSTRSSKFYNFDLSVLDTKRCLKTRKNQNEDSTHKNQRSKIAIKEYCKKGSRPSCNERMVTIVTGCSPRVGKAESEGYNPSWWPRRSFFNQDRGFGNFSRCVGRL